MKKNLVLTTETGGRVTLRVPGKEDLPFVQALWADPETMAAVGGPVEMTDKEMARWYARMVDPGRGTDLFCIIYDEHDAPIGEVSFHRLDQEKMQADFNIKIIAARRGRGYGNEAMALLLGYFFEVLGGKLMTDDLAPDNAAGQQALKRFGFRHNPEIPGVYRLEMTRQAYFNRSGS